MCELVSTGGESESIQWALVTDIWVVSNHQKLFPLEHSSIYSIVWYFVRPLYSVHVVVYTYSETKPELLSYVKKGAFAIAVVSFCEFGMALKMFVKQVFTISIHL